MKRRRSNPDKSQRAGRPPRGAAQRGSPKRAPLTPDEKKAILYWVGVVVAWIFFGFTVKDVFIKVWVRLHGSAYQEVSFRPDSMRYINTRGEDRLLAHGTADGRPAEVYVRSFKKERNIRSQAEVPPLEGLSIPLLLADDHSAEDPFTVGGRTLSAVEKDFMENGNLSLGLIFTGALAAMVQFFRMARRHVGRRGLAHKLSRSG